MKRLVSVITALLICATFVAACSAQAEDPTTPALQGVGALEEANSEDPQRIRIICTIFPLYDWTRQIIGEENLDRFDLTFLINSGIDLHSFNPSVSDIARIKTSDVFIYIGGHSDSWVENVLRGASPDLVAMNMLDILAELTDEQPLLDGFCEVDCDDDHDHNFELPHADEHVWLSLSRAITLCAAIADMLAELDPENALIYADNASAYIAELSSLDARFQAAVNEANVTTLVFADRFPFRYMFNDYGLTYYAAFRGCSAESEASFVTIISLANRINQLGLSTVLVTESSNQSIARTVISNTETADQRILVLNAVHSVTVSEARTGVTYLSLMENNLVVLHEALR